VSESDRDLVGDVRRGNREAFGQLVRKYQGRLFGLVLMMVREPAGVEEVTQDAFVRAYTHLDRYDEQRPFYPWVAAIAVRLSQNRLRAHVRVLRREVGGPETVDEPGVNATMLSDLIDDERSRALWEAVAMLPSGERTAVTFYYRDGLTLPDIARGLGVTTGTIKTLLFRARRHLRERLAPGEAHSREASS
jgi:RNA polymerase sigma-70 factor (ECF subfamily)